MGGGSRVPRRELDEDNRGGGNGGGGAGGGQTVAPGGPSV